MSKRPPSFFAPEVIQTSGMDCGPASLKCLLEGFGITAHYGRLREACQTDVDGTSIDTLEEVAKVLGLDAEQIMVPLDHLLLEGNKNLPAIVVVQLPSGFTHFVVVWGTFGPWLQIMDPATGRRWVRKQHFLDEVFLHQFAVGAQDWREWASTKDFLNPLRLQMKSTGCSPEFTEKLLKKLLHTEAWFPLASLDALIRMVGSLKRAGGLGAGKEVEALISTLMKKTLEEVPGQFLTIPKTFWSILSLKDKEQVIFRGAVLVRVKGHKPPGVEEADELPLSLELSAAITPDKPFRVSDMFHELKKNGVLALSFIIPAIFLSTFGRLVEFSLLRVLIDFNQMFTQSVSRMAGMGYLLIFLALMVLLQFPIPNLIYKLGRHVEIYFRLAFLKKIPKLEDRYFHSRPISDMADRGHRVFFLRNITTFSGRLVLIFFEFLFTLLGIVWIDNRFLPWALFLIGIVVVLPVVLESVLGEQNAKVLTHGGALSRFYLESLLGLHPIRSHGAEGAVQHEQEGLLVEWVKASRSFLTSTTTVFCTFTLVPIGLAVIFIFDHIRRIPVSGVTLLLVFWLLKLPDLLQRLAQMAMLIPNLKNTAKRILEPLGAPENDENTSTPTEPENNLGSPGVSIDMAGLSVLAGGHTILSDINLKIPSGEHLAILGPSGAGKSTLAGLLLGWHRFSQGTLRVDGHILNGHVLSMLRPHTAWVDPTIQLWNRSLYNNLKYGGEPSYELDLTTILTQADLLQVLERLPQGLQTSLGENGGLVSGGEGQRVRFGRALQRSNAKLVILDEPFRGLDREIRKELLLRARQHWKEATLICISHDVALTFDFDRVVLMEHGQIREIGKPRELASQNSYFSELLEQEQKIFSHFWSAPNWRHIEIQNGLLRQVSTPLNGLSPNSKNAGKHTPPTGGKKSAS